jgi:hypothetical protein
VLKVHKADLVKLLSHIEPRRPQTISIPLAGQTFKSIYDIQNSRQDREISTSDLTVEEK